MYMFIHFHTSFESYKQVHTMYKNVYVANVMTRQRAFSESYDKSYRKKESRSKALRVICEVGL